MPFIDSKVTVSVTEEQKEKIKSGYIRNILNYSDRF